ncbi:MAG: substrate-binding domain-containing protein [Tenericutes bacterium]|jgi:phosphate transport system substrate-binding protein|nr:substrate-binding domain-containing protein [Mycoplasmatota bacterium]
MKKLILGLTMIVVLTLAACSNASGEWGSSSNITVYTRDTSSGTRAGFMGGIGFDEAAEDDSQLVDGFVINDNTGILTSMATDEYGIGYISLSSLDDSVKGLQFEGVDPTIANVINNTYALKRPFNYVIRSLDDFTNETEKNITLAFIGFLNTTDASDIITNEGAISLQTSDTWDDIKDDYNVCRVDNSDVTIRFGGSDSIEQVAKALTDAFAPKCGNFVAEHDHTGSSDGFKRTQGTEKDGDNYKHVGFASRPFKDTETGSESTQGQLAWDAIVVIVHNDNFINNMTSEDLKKIYGGQFLTWDELL